MHFNCFTDASPVPNTCILGTQTGCSTSVAAGLAKKVVAELNSMGYTFKSLNTTWIHCSGTCTLQAAAADSLMNAAKSKNDYITINSAFRDSGSQYMLYNWYLKGICGISLAAQPGTSNHEGGRAIDTSNYNYWLSTLANYGWVHSYPSSDPVHFDYTKSSDLAKYNLIAFQRLYNRANPSKKIAEVGIYGPNTEKALYNTPCDGW